MDNGVRILIDMVRHPKFKIREISVKKVESAELKKELEAAAKERGIKLTIEQ